MAAVFTVGFFAVVEVALVVAEDDWSELYSGDPGYDWRLKPNLDLHSVPHLEEGASFSVQTNMNGLRDDPIPASKPWVLALGCSTTFGWGVDNEEVWTEVLEDRLGLPVVNAGIPGHSTVQGMGWGKALMQRSPSVVLLGWGLRDAQQTTVPDADRRPTPFPRNTRLYRTLSQWVLSPPIGTQPRVAEDRYQDNMTEMIAYAKTRGIKVLLVDMTARSESPNHGRVLQGLESSVFVPNLSDADHFENDPIHLNVQGHRKFASQIAGSVKVLLSSSAEAQQSEPALPQTP